MSMTKTAYLLQRSLTGLDNSKIRLVGDKERDIFPCQSVVLQDLHRDVRHFGHSIFEDAGPPGDGWRREVAAGAAQGRRRLAPAANGAGLPTGVGRADLSRSSTRRVASRRTGG